MLWVAIVALFLSTLSIFVSFRALWIFLESRKLQEVYVANSQRSLELSQESRELSQESRELMERIDRGIEKHRKIQDTIYRALEAAEKSKRAGESPTERG